MDSELTSIASVKALNQGVATTDSPSFAGLVATTADINGGTIDGATVGASSASNGAFTTLSATGVLTANAGVVVDNFTLDGTTLALSSGDMTLDVAGDIILDADGGDFKFRDGGAGFFTISNSSLDAVLKVEQSNEDFIIKGNDGGSEITALTLDMSAAGAATFASSVSVGGATPQGNLTIKGSSSDDIDLLTFSEDGTNQSFSFNGNFAGAGSTGNSFCLDSYWQNDIMVWGGDGNVGIGTSSFTSSAAGRTVLEVNGASASALINLSVNGTRQGYIFTDTTDMYVYNVDNGSLNFGTNNTERLRITGAGDLALKTDGAAIQLYYTESRDFISNNGAQAIIKMIDNNANNAMIDFRSWTDASLMRLMNTGVLLVGQAVTSSIGGTPPDDNGIEIGSGYINLNRDDTATARQIQFGKNGSVVGYVETTGSATSYATSSDYRLKEDDVPMTGATERVKALRPINFAWKADGSRVDGFFAHEAQEIVPECVTGTKDAMRDEEYEVTAAVEEVRDADDNITTEAVEAVMGTRSVPDMQGIDQSKLVPLLTAALQEAITKIESLTTRIEALEA